MIDLILSVFFSSLIFIIFKLFDIYKVQIIYAIVVNYIVAGVTGIIFYPGHISLSEVYSQDWFAGTLLLGVLFITVFNIMGRSSQVNGVGVTSVATKMSLVIPVVFGVLYYDNRLSFWQIVGILLALIAVYLVSIKKKGVPIQNKHIWLPILVFLGSGIIDTSIKTFQNDYLTEGEFPLFSATVFGGAALAGVTYIGYTSIKMGFSLNFKNVLGGIILGVPNYFSIFFLLRALNNEVLGTATVFTLNNVGIVLLCTLFGVFFFEEKLTAKNWIGMGIAILSIVLVVLF